MQEQRQFRGIWLNQFEGSRYFDGVTFVPEGETQRAVWLEFDHKSGGIARPRHSQQGEYYIVEFVGRAARDMDREPLDGYGHFSMSNGMILVDELLSISPVRPRR